MIPTTIRSDLQLQSDVLAELKEIREIDKRIQMKEEEIAKENTQKVDYQMIREVLGDFTQIFGELTPYDQQQTTRYLIDHVVCSAFEMKIAVDTGVYISAIKRGPTERSLGPPSSGVDQTSRYRLRRNRDDLLCQ